MSLRFQADNDLKFAIVKAVRNREPAVEFVSAQSAGLDGIPDPDVLDFIAKQGRVLVTHDRRTMVDHFRHHLAMGKSSPGILIVSQFAGIGDVVEAIVSLWALADSADLQNQAHYLPSLSRHLF